MDRKQAVREELAAQGWLSPRETARLKDLLDDSLTNTTEAGEIILELLAEVESLKEQLAQARAEGAREAREQCIKYAIERAKIAQNALQRQGISHYEENYWQGQFQAAQCVAAAIREAAVTETENG